MTDNKQLTANNKQQAENNVEMNDGLEMVSGGQRTMAVNSGGRRVVNSVEW